MKELISIPNETIISKIFFIRGKKVMFDKDLTELYGVETKVLNQTVKRNVDRFPEDFMFKLNEQEAKIWRERYSKSQSMTLEKSVSTKTQNLRSQSVTSSLKTYGGQRYSPVVFTEQGVAMLSSVLKSKQAVHMNIQIIRTFTKLREILSENKKLAEKIGLMEQKYDSKIGEIFRALRYLTEEKEKPRQKIGFSVPKIKDHVQRETNEIIEASRQVKRGDSYTGDLKNILEIRNVDV